MCLGLCGLSQDQYPYSGYVAIRIKFPMSIARIEKEVSTIITLVCPDPGWMKGASFIKETNSSICQVLAWYCRQLVWVTSNNYKCILCALKPMQGGSRRVWELTPRSCKNYYFLGLCPKGSQPKVSEHCPVCKWERGPQQVGWVMVETFPRKEGHGVLRVFDRLFETQSMSSEPVTVVVVNPTMGNIVVHPGQKVAAVREAKVANPILRGNPPPIDHKRFYFGDSPVPKP